jgi:hypothetical protein
VPAIERLIENIEYVKSYFIGINQEEIPDIIVEFIWNPTENGISL